MEQRLRRWPHLPLIEGSQIVKAEVTHEDQRELTARLTERAVEFIERNRERPFFVYLAHPQPHVPLFAGEGFEGTTERGLYGDVIEEIDWSMGRIMDTLEKHGLADNTLVIFTSDNGPWLSYGTHSGSAGSLREGKGTVWEGGIRVPCLVRWPERIPAGLVVSEKAATIDVLPTIARWIGAELPAHKIDGRDISPLLEGVEGAKSPHEALFFYYNQTELQALRSGRWKLILPHSYRSLRGREGRDDGFPIEYQQNQTGLELYDLVDDIGETTNLAETRPEVMERLMRLADGMRADLGDRLTGVKGAGRRPPGGR